MGTEVSEYGHFHHSVFFFVLKKTKKKNTILLAAKQVEPDALSGSPTAVTVTTIQDTVVVSSVFKKEASSRHILENAENVQHFTGTLPPNGAQKINEKGDGKQVILSVLINVLVRRPFSIHTRCNGTLFKNV